MYLSQRWCVRVVASTVHVRHHAVAPAAMPLCRWTPTAPRPPALKAATARRIPSKAVSHRHRYKVLGVGGQGKTRICIAPRREHTSRAQVWHAFSRDLTVLPAHPAFIRYGINHAMPFFSQPKLVLICCPRRDGRLSWPESMSIERFERAHRCSAFRILKDLLIYVTFTNFVNSSHILFVLGAILSVNSKTQQKWLSMSFGSLEM